MRLWRSIAVLALVVMLIFALGAAVLATDVHPQSMGIAVGANTLSLAYLQDGNHYGITIGATVARQARWSLFGLATFEPTNGSQITVGTAVGYDILCFHVLTLTPVIGFLQPITHGYDNQSFRPSPGLFAKFSFGSG